MAHLILPEAGVKNGEIAMNPEQIKDEIRKLNWIDKIGIYRWINQEVAGDRGIGTDRSRQIRQEIERICEVPGPGRRPTIRREQEPIERADQSQPHKSQAPS